MKQTITIEISKEEIGQLIKSHVESQYPEARNSDVSFLVGTRIEGYGAGEIEVIYFDGATVSFTKNI